MTKSNAFGATVRGARRRGPAAFALLTAAATLAVSGCAHQTSGTQQPSQTQAGSGSGVTVYGTVDAGLGRTGR